jgi:hypothetical protein
MADRIYFFLRSIVLIVATPAVITISGSIPECGGTNAMKGQRVMGRVYPMARYRLSRRAGEIRIRKDPDGSGMLSRVQG